MSETSAVTTPLIDTLNGIPGVKCQRFNAGKPLYRFKGAERGTPDIIGCALGRCFLIECKKRGGKTDKDRAITQRRVQNEWAMAGAAVFAGVESVADGVSLIRALMRKRAV